MDDDDNDEEKKKAGARAREQRAPDEDSPSPAFLPLDLLFLGLSRDLSSHSRSTRGCERVSAGCVFRELKAIMFAAMTTRRGGSFYTHGEKGGHVPE